jgi:hypothetical protein
MGLQRSTTVFVDGKAHACDVHLEPGEIVCRGELRQSFAHVDMKRLKVIGTRLEFRCANNDIAIELAKSAPTWLDRIKNPRTRMQKLGVAPGLQVCVLGRAPADALAEIAEILGAKPKQRLAAGADLVLCVCDEPRELERLADVEPKLAARGALWVLWPKGRKDFAHDHVVAAGKGVGLSITKSVGFSDTLTGLRLVRAKRK